MVQNTHLCGSKNTEMVGNTYMFQKNTYMVQNKHLNGSKQTLYGSKQTFTWFKSNT